MRSDAKVPAVGPIGKKHGHRLVGLLGLALFAALAFAQVASAAPSAAQAYAHLTSFGGGELASEIREAPGGIAVEPGTGNILVADEQNMRVAVFTPDSLAGGTPLTTFGASDNYFPRSIAVDQGTGAIYVSNKNEGILRRYQSDGAPTPTYSLDVGFNVVIEDGLGALAVDPTTHDVLVSEPSHGRISRFDSTGAPLGSFDASGTAAGAFSSPSAMAVAADGTLYVVDDLSQVERFSAAGAFEGTLPLQGTSPSTVAVDPSTGAVVVTTNLEFFGADPGSLEVFTPTGTEVARIRYPDSTLEATAGGLAIGSSGRLYSYLNEGWNGTPVASVYVFQPATVPGVEAPVASNVTAFGAHLSGEVDTGPVAPGETTARFEYSDDGGATWQNSPDQSADISPVEADLALAPNTSYLVRLRAANSKANNISTTSQFSTAIERPEALTGAATDLSETGAVVNASINPFGLQASFHFEYGTTAAYGSRAPAVAEAVAGNGHSSRSFGRTLSDLQPGTTYHYRVVAQSSAGISEGVDKTFTTLPTASIERRAYEQVTPVEKAGAVIDARIGFHAKADGSAMSYVTRPPGEGVGGAPWFARSMTVRGADRWGPELSLSPPSQVTRKFIGQTTLGESSDFTHTFVVSNSKLTPDAIEGGANLYVCDLSTGSYTLVASSNVFGAFDSFVSLQTANKFIGGAPDFDWVVFGSVVPLLPGVEHAALYRWSADRGLELESALPDGSPAAANIFLQTQNGASRSISVDGSRDYFTLIGAGEDGVYLREGGVTKAISVSHIAGDPATPRAAQLLGVGKDGRHAFFYSAGAQLTSDAPGLPGDLYRYDASDQSLEYLGGQATRGAPEFVASLGVSSDGSTIYFDSLQGAFVWRNGELHLVVPTGIALGEAFLSPNGRYFAYRKDTLFTSDTNLYFYDAETQQSWCASCRAGASSGVGGLPELERYSSNRVPQAIDDRGRFFFDTPERLVAADANGLNDVYVFQDGKASLISPGNAPFEARFGDISEDGSNVFFVTQQKLVGQDDDGAPDIYDARVGGGLASQNPPPSHDCIRDDCKGTPGVGPELPFGGSEGLNGPENVRPAARKRCGKGRHVRQVKGKPRCVKKSAAKRKHAKHNRRQGR